MTSPSSSPSARRTAILIGTAKVPSLGNNAVVNAVSAGGKRLMLSPAEGDAAGTSVLYFLVTDIHAVARTLGERGVTLVGEPHMIARMPDHELWLAEFRDSEGNVMALMEEKRPV